MTRITAAATVAGFIACILAANYVTTEFGLVPIGFGLVTTAGTYLAGVTFILRDSIQDQLGKRAAAAAIIVGAVLSYAISDPFIALASGVAFLFSELADLAVYTPLRKRGYLRAAVASNIVGAFVDTFLFLSIAGFPIAVWEGQVVGKLVVTAVFVIAVAGYRTRQALA